MRERGIIMTGESVRAILDGRKTQTRRVMVPQPRNPLTFGISPIWGYGVHEKGEHAGHFCVHAAFDVGGKRVDRFVRCPYGRPYDHLWVRESCLIMRTEVGAIAGDEWNEVMYTDDDDFDVCRPTQGEAIDLGWRLRTGRFMPRWASRLTLEITDVRVERVQDITDADVEAEGVEPTAGWLQFAHRHAFMGLWDSLNAKRGYGWNANPWVWVLSFRVLGAAARPERAPVPAVDRSRSIPTGASA